LSFAATHSNCVVKEPHVLSSLCVSLRQADT
jgi:hypothetical protein